MAKTYKDICKSAIKAVDEFAKGSKTIHADIIVYCESFPIGEFIKVPISIHKELGYNNSCETVVLHIMWPLSIVTPEKRHELWETIQPQKNITFRKYMCNDECVLECNISGGCQYRKRICITHSKNSERHNQTLRKLNAELTELQASYEAGRS